MSPPPFQSTPGSSARPRDDRKVLVSVRALCKDYVRPNGTQFTALEGINLEVNDGEFLAVLGLSGSGKSTLLRCMAGLLKPDRGQVSYAKPPSQAQQLVSFVFQSFALFPWLTVRENVELALQRLPRAQRQGKVDAILALVNLSGFEDVYPRELSGGMRQRVSIARAMVCDPMVMFMDEPFSALDPLTSESLRAEMGRLWVQPSRTIRSVVLVTHSLQEALQLADRIVILSSSPGTIYRTIEVPLARPRMSNARDFQDLEAYLERTFGELHLDKLTGSHYDLQIFPTDMPGGTGSSGQPGVPGASAGMETAGLEAAGTGTTLSRPPPRRIKPLINTSLVLVEGLLARLSEEKGAMDLYDIADEMGQSVDQMLPAVASAEMLGFISTPGTRLVFTELGRAFVGEQEPQSRQAILRDAVKDLPVVNNIYEVVRSHKEEGLEKSIAVEQLVLLLPFEDPDVQFEALLKWARHVDLLTYDSQSETLFVEE
jgi:NitT/TauT family transport system ATP-binding protein